MRELKTFYLRTYGCQMNELDSEIMIGQLLKRGLTRIDEEEAADLLIFNSRLSRAQGDGEDRQNGKKGPQKSDHRRHWLYGQCQEKFPLQEIA